MRDVPPEGATILAFRRPAAAKPAGAPRTPVALTHTGKPLSLVSNPTRPVAARTVHLQAEGRPPILAITRALMAQNVPVSVASFTAVAVATGKKASLTLPPEADMATLLTALAVHKVRLTF